MNFKEAIAELRYDIKSVAPEQMSLAFHVNTKMAHLLSGWRRGLAQGVNSEAFDRWCGFAGDFAATLPKAILVADGATGVAVDPFRGIRAVFRTNRVKPLTDLPRIVECMLLEAEAAGLKFTSQDHGNLIELAAGIGLISRTAEKAFFNEVLHQPTYAESEASMLEELQVQAVLGESKLTPIPNGFIAISCGKLGGVFDSPTGKILRITGYDGCICDFPIYEDAQDIVVAQLVTHAGTSITNLSETIFETLQLYKPASKVYQVYEQDILAGVVDITEVLIDADGHPGWLSIDSPVLLAGIMFRIDLAGPDMY